MRKMAHLKLMNIYLYKRMLNVQRIVLLLLYVTFTVPSLAEVATMQLPQLSLNLNNVTRREVFNTIEKNTKYVFIYSDELLTELNEKVSIHVNKQTLFLRVYTNCYLILIGGIFHAEYFINYLQCFIYVVKQY